MSNLTEVRRSAREYPGSYRIIWDGKMTLNGKRVSFIHYTNPNNCTNAEYLEYKCGNIEKGLTVYSGVNIEQTLKDIFNV